MSDDKFELSRRNALIGLGTVGAASAGAGMGTSAYFTDEESFDGNEVTAGELNLELSGGIIYTNRDGGTGNADVSVAGANSVVNDDDGANLVINLDDVKPGDCYVLHTDEVIEDNPAYLEMSMQDASGEGGGGLADDMEVELWYGGTNTSGSGDGSLVDPANVTSCDLSGGVTPRSDPLVASQTLGDAYDGLAEGDDNTDGDAGVNDEFVPGGSEALELDPGTWRKFWVFRMPTTVGNEAQGESATFNIKARIVQARNNDASSPSFTQ